MTCRRRWAPRCGSTSTTPTTVTLTISCQGLPTQTCSGPIKLTSHVTTQGSKIVAVAATAKKKPKPKPRPKPKKVTKVETIATGRLLDEHGQEHDGQADAQLDGQEGC